MAGRYVRAIVDDQDENRTVDEIESESCSDDESDSTSHLMVNPVDSDSKISKMRINPLTLIDQFPEDPTMEKAREFWVDWIAMIKRLFKLNPSAFPSDEIRITVLITRGGAFLRNVLANTRHEFPDTFDEAVTRIDEYFRANSNSLADETSFGTLVQGDGESFQKFSDRVQKKARVFRLEENRAISQITRGAKQSDKLMDFGIRGKTSLVELIGYGNQLEVLMRDRKPVVTRENEDVLVSEVNAVGMNRNNRFRPYDRPGTGGQSGYLRNTNWKDRQANSSFAGSCGYCGYKHSFGKCPAFGKICENCKKRNHFKSVCRSKQSSVGLMEKLEAKVLKNDEN